MSIDISVTPVAIIGIAIAITAISTFACYFGDSFYRHRQRLAFLPKIWTVVAGTAAYSLCWSMGLGPVGTYVWSLGIASIGYVAGGEVLFVIEEGALSRIWRKVHGERWREVFYARFVGQPGG